MSILPAVFPHSYEEALEQGWSFKGLYPHPDMPLGLHSMWMGKGYYVMDAGYRANGSRVPRGKYALWIKKAPTDQDGNPLGFPLFEEWENWGIHTRSTVGGNSYLGKIESITARGNSLHMRFSHRKRQEGTGWVKDDSLDYVIDLDSCKTAKGIDPLVLELPEEVVTIWRFSPINH